MTRDELVRSLRDLGLPEGSVVLVHTSYRAVGPVERGPLGLIAALHEVIGPRGTLVMPTMTSGDAVFDPRATATVDMGITAELFWRQPGVLRSTHPGASFAASGPAAAFVCAPQPLSPPHGPDSPVGRVHALDGYVLLLGVTHAESTTLHLAEVLAAVPYSVTHPCVVERDGVVETLHLAETDHCCAGFAQVESWLADRGLAREGLVGRARAQLARARDVVEVALAHLRDDPLTFLCARGSGCDECERAHASVTDRRPTGL